jgi:hypothetical protein
LITALRQLSLALTSPSYTMFWSAKTHHVLEPHIVFSSPISPFGVLKPIFECYISLSSAIPYFQVLHCIFESYTAVSSFTLHFQVLRGIFEPYIVFESHIAFYTYFSSPTLPFQALNYISEPYDMYLYLKASTGYSADEKSNSWEFSLHLTKCYIHWFVSTLRFRALHCVFKFLHLFSSLYTCFQLLFIIFIPYGLCADEKSNSLEFSLYLTKRLILLIHLPWISRERGLTNDLGRLD